MADILLSTERLVLRRFTREDGAFGVAMWNDPDFIANVADRGIRTEADALRHLETKVFPMYEIPGHGGFVAEMRGTGEAVGFGSLLRRPDQAWSDVGYALLPGHRRRGLATEIAFALRDHARTALGLPGLYGFAGPWNTASCRILERLGMRRVRVFRWEGYTGDTAHYAVSFGAEPIPVVVEEAAGAGPEGGGASC